MIDDALFGKCRIAIFGFDAHPLEQTLEIDLHVDDEIEEPRQRRHRLDEIVALVDGVDCAFTGIVETSEWVDDGVAEFVDIVHRSKAVRGLRLILERIGGGVVAAKSAYPDATRRRQRGRTNIGMPPQRADAAGDRFFLQELETRFMQFFGRLGLVLEHSPERRFLLAPLAGEKPVLIQRLLFGASRAMAWCETSIGSDQDQSRAC